MMRLVAALLMLVGAQALVACGDAKSSTPPPETVATAESVARTISFSAKYSTTPEEGDDDEDPIELDGRVFGSGPTGVILAHMRPADQTSWFPFATELAKNDEFTVMTFDFRGYGESTGDKQFDRVDTDLAAAIDYMHNILKLDRVFLVGASMGGTASLVVAAREDVAGVVSISSPAEFAPLDALATVADIKAPKLFITAEDDIPAARSQEDLWDAAVGPKQQQVYEGDDHGTDLLTSDDAPDLEQRLIAFLSQK